VFGFSLSLLAYRLDIPNRVEDIFEPTRWLAVILTFSLICRFWLEHHRVFRHRFAVAPFDVALIFVFLFAIAVLPYSVQTFMRFSGEVAPLSLYVGDFILVSVTLSILRIRGLRQRMREPDVADRLKDWRRSVVLLTVAVLLGCLLVVLQLWNPNWGMTRNKLVISVALGSMVLIRVVRRSVRQLPSFLQVESGTRQD
jgi:uncharacterized membrane protein